MIYKIKNRNTGLYSTGDMWTPEAWSENGKIYKTLGGAKNAVRMILKQYDHEIRLGLKVTYDRPKIVIEEYYLSDTGKRFEVLS